MNFNDIGHDDPIPTYVALAKAIVPLGMAYLHVMRAGIGAEAALREAFPGTLLVGGGFGKDEANRALAEGRADAIVFGSAYLANPDLVERLARISHRVCLASEVRVQTLLSKRHESPCWASPR